jgi:hypothetical protein
MAKRKLYKQAVGKIVKEIDTLERDGEVFLGITFRDASYLGFGIYPPGTLIPYEDKSGARPRLSR